MERTESADLDDTDDGYGQTPNEHDHDLHDIGHDNRAESAHGRVESDRASNRKGRERDVGWIDVPAEKPEGGKGPGVEPQGHQEDILTDEQTTEENLGGGVKAEFQKLRDGENLTPQKQRHEDNG